MENLKQLKNKIKVIAAEQIVLKNQRKTVKLQGERKMEPWQAWVQHQNNRSNLRNLYLVYGILKGKNPEDIDKNHLYTLYFKEKNEAWKNYPDIIKITKLLELYNG